jgi:hypothetical protein
MCNHLHRQEDASGRLGCAIASQVVKQKAPSLVVREK